MNCKLESTPNVIAMILLWLAYWIQKMIEFNEVIITVYESRFRINNKIDQAQLGQNIMMIFQKILNTSMKLKQRVRSEVKRCRLKIKFLRRHQRCFNAGPASQTLAQHWAGVGSFSSRWHLVSGGGTCDPDTGRFCTAGPRHRVPQSMGYVNKICIFTARRILIWHGWLPPVHTAPFVSRKPTSKTRILCVL